MTDRQKYKGTSLQVANIDQILILGHRSELSSPKRTPHSIIHIMVSLDRFPLNYSEKSDMSFCCQTTSGKDETWQSY